VVRAHHDAGDGKVRYWLLDTAELDFGGCHYCHYSARDGRIIAQRLASFVDGLPLGW
jgi:hypothetical protein